MSATQPAAKRNPLSGLLRDESAVAHDKLIGPQDEAGVLAKVDGVPAVEAAAVEIFGLGAHGCRWGVLVRARI